MQKEFTALPDFAKPYCSKPLRASGVQIFLEQRSISGYGGVARFGLSETSDFVGFQQPDILSGRFRFGLGAKVVPAAVRRKV